MSGLGDESVSVQGTMVRYAADVGWERLSPAEATRLRRGEDGLVLHEVLVDQLQRLNPGIVDLHRAEDIIGRLTRVPPSIEGNHDAWEFLKGRKTVFVPGEARERDIALIDPRRVDRNIFHVTEEFRFTSGPHRIRPDVVFLVNGVPVLVVETKSATRRGGIEEAFRQLRRYHREGPEFMTLLQVQTLTQLVHFRYGATWEPSQKLLFDWRDESAGDTYEQLVKSFFHRQRVLRMLTDFILFTRKEGELQKVLLRPHQMRAVDRVVERAAQDDRTRGLVWHTQGSGKTYTMISAAKKIMETPAFENPLLLMLVDRNELEAQLFANLEAIGVGNVEVARSKRHLRELLERDYRGLLVSIIHKFDGIPANTNTRRNVIVLVDEAHRSTGGDFGNYLLGALPNATYLGFTGTPIDETAHGRSTFTVFGGQDEDGYLDKYSIRESIDDGTTLPLHYVLAPTELRVNRDVLEEEFLSLAENEGVADLDELNLVLDRAVNLRNMLKAPDHIDSVAQFVAEHFLSHVEPSGYKAFLVAVDREACCLYKEALDRHLPSSRSKVVISRGHNDPELFRRHHLTDDQEKETRKAFRRPDAEPSILIVTEKLLTGFDAPILQTMYLDKPMRDHVLLQAIARVNRPYDGEGRNKTSGVIVDFVSIFENLEDALAFDSEDVAGVVEDFDLLRREWQRRISEVREAYLDLGRGLSADKEVEAILEYFRSRARREEYYSTFQELEELYELLSPDAFLRPYMDDYARLSAIYRLVRASFEPHMELDRSFLRKTADLLRQHTHGGAIPGPEVVYRLDAEMLDVLADAKTPETTKVFNLLKILDRDVRSRVDQAPYLRTIGERAESIATRFHERQLDTTQALEELRQLHIEVTEADAERKSTDMSVDGFSVYWVLKGVGIGDALEIARHAEVSFTAHPHWRSSPAQEREMRRELYQVLLSADIRKVTQIVNRIVEMLRSQ